MKDARPLLGIGLMLLAMTILPLIDVLAKLLGQSGLPILIIVWARAVFGTLTVLPFALRTAGPAAFRTRQPLHHLARAVLLYSATFLFFLSLRSLPIADALAIFFVNPLIVTVLSALVLGETVGPRRRIALALGFLGTLVIIRPGLVPLNQGTLLALGAGVALASYFVLTRQIAGRAPAMVLTFQTTALGAVLLTLALPFVWVTPAPHQWPMLAGVGIIATLGHALITLAYEEAEASLLAPLAFTEIITATALGWAFFGDLPDRWTVLGVAILIGSAIYIALRERRPVGKTPLAPLPETAD